MKARTVLILIGVTAGIMALGFVGVALVVRTAHAVRREYMSEEARQVFVSRWKPPASTGVEEVLPRAINGYQRDVVEDAGTLQNPDLGRVGARGTYQRPGRTPIEVFVTRPTEQESATLVARIRGHYDRPTRTGAKVITEVPGRLRMELSDPVESVEVWTLSGWLFVFRTPGELEAEWIRAYLAAIAKQDPSVVR